MAYHTIQDLANKLTTEAVIQLTDDGDNGSLDSSITDQAAATAAGIIDGYLRGRYALPLATVPDLIREVSLTLAVHWLYQRRMGNESPKRIQDEKADAIKLLEHIVDGKICLFEDDRSAMVLTNKTAEDRDFSDTMLRQF